MDDKIQNESTPETETSETHGDSEIVEELTFEDLRLVVGGSESSSSSSGWS
ncbi:MAG: hypothetical protein GDA50_06435 [Alphaproteobacteria bacterium GM202ARS2]|nr:hypothetical protein [Alphaproteobacteria bacterium GM202ARS2]